MPATYTDIVNAMIHADRDGKAVDSVVLTQDSINTFLRDDNFTKEQENEMEKQIGNGWNLEINRGESDYLLLETGEEIEL